MELTDLMTFSAVARTGGITRAAEELNTVQSNVTQRVKALEAEIGATYVGTVSRIVDFGAFVEIFPGTDGLLHISEIAETRIKEVRDELKEGDQILVKVLALEGNKIKLSRRAILKEEREKLKAGAPA